jgi:hypothetical protein
VDLHDGRERGLRVTNNMDGVVIEGNAFGSTLKVKGNVGGTTVTGNTVDKSLTGQRQRRTGARPAERGSRGVETAVGQAG